MSLYHSGESCAYCKAKLFSDDDVVYCPECGAPHHRKCYNNLGHCALETLHGTENEYSKEKELEKQQKAEEERRKREAEQNQAGAQFGSDVPTTRCKMCGTEYEFRKASCPKCGAPNFVRANGVAFDFYGGIDPETEIADSVTAKEVKKFVLTNTHRYIPKFARFKSGKKVSWNWLAFFFPSCWMFSRKMYKGGIITTVLLLIASILIIPLSQELISLGVYENATSYVEVFKNIYNATALLSTEIMLFSGLNFLINFSVKIVCALFGDYWYKNYTVKSIKKIRNESHDSEFDYRKKGGVNIFAFLIAYMALTYLPQFIEPFI